MPQRIDVGRRIDNAAKAEIRVLGLDAGDQRHVAAPHQLVGHQDAAHTVAVGGIHLRGCCQCDAPGAVLQLPMEQGRAHGGLAMGRQLHPIAGHEGLHPAQVVLDAAFAQHGHRQAHLVVKNAPLQVLELGQSASVRCGTQALGVEVQVILGKEGCSGHRRSWSRPDSWRWQPFRVRDFQTLVARNTWTQECLFRRLSGPSR